MTQQEMFGGETLAAARARVRKEMWEGGCRCPCCNRIVRVYRYRLNETMVDALAWLAAKTENDGWVDVPKFGKRRTVRSNQLGTLANWGVVEQKHNTDSRKRCSGIWRATEKGRQFLRREISLSSHVLVLNVGHEFQGFDGDPVWVDDLLPNFDYAEFMADIPTGRPLQ